MSTRYVWGRYTAEPTLMQGTAVSYELIQVPSPHANYWAYSSNYTLNGNTLTLHNVGSDYAWTRHSGSVPAGCVFVWTGDDKAGQDVVVNLTTDTTVRIAINNTTFYLYSNDNSSITFNFSGSFAGVSSGYSAGSLIGYVSANANSAYPQDGVSGSYWYEYQGQDSIDARGCAIFSR